MPNFPASSLPTPERSLGVNISEEASAIQQDLKEADLSTRNLATQVPGDSKELLHLKFLLKQAKTRFDHLQDCVVLLRKERHQLANEAMRVQALELQLSRTTGERDSLKAQVEALLEGLASEGRKRNSLVFDDRDRRIIELTVQSHRLKAELIELQKQKPPLTRVNSSQETIGIKEDTFLIDERVEIVPTAQIVRHRR